VPRLNLPCNSSSSGSFKHDPFGTRIYKSSSAGTLVYAHDGDSLKSGQLLALHLVK